MPLLQLKSAETANEVGCGCGISEPPFWVSSPETDERSPSFSGFLDGFTWFYHVFSLNFNRTLVRGLYSPEARGSSGRRRAGHGGRGPEAPGGGGHREGDEEPQDAGPLHRYTYPLALHLLI